MAYFLIGGSNMKLVKKGSLVMEDCYVISKKERREIMEYRKTFNKFFRFYSNSDSYSKRYL